MWWHGLSSGGPLPQRLRNGVAAGGALVRPPHPLTPLMPLCPSAITMSLSPSCFALTQYAPDAAAAPSIAEDRHKAAHFYSFDALKEQRTKHVPAECGPKDTFKAPVTLCQEIGWEAEKAEKNMVRYPKRQCAETKFASALAQSGYI